MLAEPAVSPTVLLTTTVDDATAKLELMNPPGVAVKNEVSDTPAKSVNDEPVIVKFESMKNEFTKANMCALPLGPPSVYTSPGPGSDTLEMSKVQLVKFPPPAPIS